MTEMPLLSITIFLPLLGALVILLIKEDEHSVNNIKKVALWTSVGVFLLSLLIWLQFDNNNGSYQFEEKFRWFNDFNFSYHIGICLLYTSPSPRDAHESRMPSSA